MKQSTKYADLSMGPYATAPRGVAMAIRFMRRNLTRPLTAGEIALCVILRSLQTGDVALLAGRKTLRSPGDSETYPAGVAASSYQLVINDIAVDIGDGKTGLSKPSFKNTLSAGDRTTLALAFFLAHLERDPDRANRIVVFDDPFNSQDAFRRHQTVYRIKQAAEQCAQIIVLSHDAVFLRQVWDKCPTDQRVAIQITDHRALGSKIGLCNLEEACKGRVANEIDDLLSFYNTGSGKAHDKPRKCEWCWRPFAVPPTRTALKRMTCSAR